MRSIAALAVLSCAFAAEYEDGGDVTLYANKVRVLRQQKKNALGGAHAQQ